MIELINFESDLFGLTGSFRMRSRQGRGSASKRDGDKRTEKEAATKIDTWTETGAVIEAVTKTATEAETEAEAEAEAETVI